MDLAVVASRVALSQPLSDRPDYGSKDQTGTVEKTPGKGYCVKSEKSPDWKGGCYPTKSEAKKRLNQVEMFKHMKASSLFAVAAKVASGPGVKILKLEWDPGDKRSYGEFEVTAETPVGLLSGKGLISSGGEAEDDEWTLDGQPLMDGASGPDLGMPHYYAGGKAMSRFEKVMDSEVPETIAEWAAAYASDLASGSSSE